MDRDAFLSRVRSAARAGQAYRVDLHDFPDDTGYVGAGDDLCASMAAEVDAVGGSATIVDNHEQAREALVHLLDEYSVGSALCWQHPVLDRLGLKKLLNERQVESLSYETLFGSSHDQQRTKMLAADIGISSVDWAIAETGTLLVCSRPGQERVASLLPPVHVAVVERQQIVPDLIDAFDQLSEMGDGLPSNISLITGPSKTGDIELQLTTGVHGPGKWHVIIVS